MGEHIAEYESLRNPQFAYRGIVATCAELKMERMERIGLKRARKAAGLTQQQIADRMGVPVPQISRWESGKDGIPSQRLQSLQTAYEANLRDLFEEAESVSFLDSNARVVAFEGASDIMLNRDVPIVGSSLGAPREFDGKAIEQTMLNSGEIIGYLPRPSVLNGQASAYGVYVQGSSMDPRFEDGDHIFATDSRRSMPPRIGDDVIVYLRDMENDDGERASAVLIKRLVRRTASLIELQQFNPAVNFTIEADKVLRMDRVIPWRELLS